MTGVAVPEEQRTIQQNTLRWPVLESRRRVAIRWASIVLQSLGFLPLAFATIHFWFSFAAVFFLLMVVWCGLALALNILHQAQPAAVVLTPTHLIDRSLRVPQRIPLHSVSQVCEFSSCLEVTFEVSDRCDQAPALWRLTRESLFPEHWAEFAGHLKEIVRRLSPSATIYDSHTGPPPAPQK